MKKVIVTGSAGRLGRYVLSELAEHGYRAEGIDTSGNIHGDLTDLSAVYDALEDATAVVHLARERFPYTEQGEFDRKSRAWRMPDIRGDAERLQRNMAMALNVLAASLDCGVERLVMGSSLAVYGFYYQASSSLPDVLPVDEEHPRRPQDFYGLSKLMTEEACDAVCRRSNIRIASLRFAGIADTVVYERLAGRRSDPLVRGFGSFWSYIDVRDAAAACRLAIEANFNGHEAFNICSPSTYLTMPTRPLLEEHFPGVRASLPEDNEFYCCYDTRKAAALLDFIPRYTMESTLEAQ